MSNDGELIDVWRVGYFQSGEFVRIVFDDRSEAIEHAENVLGNIFEELCEDGQETITIERTKMLRSEYDGLEDL